MASSVGPDSKTGPASSGPVRMFGRWQLMRLVGKSERSMAWAVSDPHAGADLLLMLPRVQPAGRVAMERWAEAVQRGSRLRHPHLAPLVEQGVQDGWPFAAYDMQGQAPLSERLGRQGLAGLECAALALQALGGLAYAHEGGVAHHDLQTWALLVDDQGALRVAGLEVAAPADATGSTPGTEAPALRAQRDAAQRDVLALGLVLHQVLAGTPALDEPDTGRVIARLPPAGREFVRLPWNTAQPVPEPLRAIVNRATDRQERQRYRNARTFARAVEGWQKAENEAGGGPLALLTDKLRAAGTLPASPAGASQAARLALMERQRTNELADVVLRDLALSFELLRAVNSAQVRGMQVSGSGPVLTLRRAIAMLGLEGVRRAAHVLRPWPGPLDDTGAALLERLIERVKRAGRVALALRPAGYDAEVVYLVTLLQNLGRLVVQYHVPDESGQIRRLMQPAPSAHEGEPDQPGMTEEAAAFAVLGADIESIGAAVARHWGLDDGVLHLIRRQNPTAPVHAGDHEDEMLRLVASAANETIDAVALPAAAVPAALQRVVQRYGRVLGIGQKELQEALQQRDTSAPVSSIGFAPSAPMSMPMPLEGGPAAPAEGAAKPAGAPGGLRAAAAARAAR